MVRLASVLLFALDVVKGPYVHCYHPTNPFPDNDGAAFSSSLSAKSNRNGSATDPFLASVEHDTDANRADRSPLIQNSDQLRDVFVPRNEFCCRVSWMYEAESGQLYVYYPEEIPGECYMRKTLRYTLCFVFTIDPAATVSRHMSETLIAPYSIVLANIAEELRGAEVKYNYVSRGLARESASLGALGVAATGTPDCGGGSSDSSAPNAPNSRHASIISGLNCSNGSSDRVAGRPGSVSQVSSTAGLKRSGALSHTDMEKMPDPGWSSWGITTSPETGNTSGEYPGPHPDRPTPGSQADPIRFTPSSEMSPLNSNGTTSLSSPAPGTVVPFGSTNTGSRGRSNCASAIMSPSVLQTGWESPVSVRGVASQQQHRVLNSDRSGDLADDERTTRGTTTTTMTTGAGGSSQPRQDTLSGAAEIKSGERTPITGGMAMFSPTTESEMDQIVKTTFPPQAAQSAILSRAPRNRRSNQLARSVVESGTESVTTPLGNNKTKHESLNVFMTNDDREEEIQWTPLPTLVEMIYRSLHANQGTSTTGAPESTRERSDSVLGDSESAIGRPGSDGIVHLSGRHSFHVRCMPQRQATTTTTMDEVPIAITRSFEQLEWADLVVNDVFQMIDGVRTVGEIITAFACGRGPSDNEEHEFLERIASPLTRAAPSFELLHDRKNDSNCGSACFPGRTLSPTAVQGIPPACVSAWYELEPVVVEALQHLTFHNYIRMVRPIRLNSVYRTTHAFVEILRSRHHPGRALLGRSLLDAYVSVVKLQRTIREIKSTSENAKKADAAAFGKGGQIIWKSATGNWSEKDISLSASAALCALGKFTNSTVRAVCHEMRTMSMWSEMYGGWEEVCCRTMVEIALLNGWLDELYISKSGEPPKSSS